jgi:hypothetical protein
MSLCQILVIPNVIMLNIIMPNVIMLNVIMLNVIMLNVIMLNAIMPNVILLNVIISNIIMLNVITSNDIMLNAIILSIAVQLTVIVSNTFNSEKYVTRHSLIQRKNFKWFNQFFQRKKMCFFKFLLPLNRPRQNFIRKLN